MDKNDIIKSCIENLYCLQLNATTLEPVNINTALKIIIYCLEVYIDEAELFE